MSTGDEDQSFTDIPQAIKKAFKLPEANADLEELAKRLDELRDGEGEA